MKSKPIKKVAALVLREGSDGQELLVFDHPTESDGILVQLPAGTIERGEDPDVAVLRELREETGVNGRLLDLAGVLDHTWCNEFFRRWIYIVESTADLPDQWPYHCDCGIPTLCRWIPFQSETINQPQMEWIEVGRAFFNGTKSEEK